MKGKGKQRKGAAQLFTHKHRMAVCLFWPGWKPESGGKTMKTHTGLEQTVKTIISKEFDSIIWRVWKQQEMYHYSLKLTHNVAIDVSTTQRKYHNIHYFKITAFSLEHKRWTCCRFDGLKCHSRRRSTRPTFFTTVCFEWRKITQWLKPALG